MPDTKNDFMNFRFFLDLLFPIECIGCGEEGRWLCKDCLNKIKLLSEQYCPICKTRLTNGRVCELCSSESFLDGAVIAVSYDNELIDKAIHYLKYRGIKDLARSLGKLLIQILGKVDFWDVDWVLVPVPLHNRRQRFRGFNQAELMAREVLSVLNLGISDNLYRSKHTHSQMKLKREERLKNIVDAFKIKMPEDLAGKKIILIDDVMTTGATLEECAKALKGAGVVEVWAVAVARGR
jgi:ComF family protein